MIGAVGFHASTQPTSVCYLIAPTYLSWQRINDEKQLFNILGDGCDFYYRHVWADVFEYLSVGSCVL